MTARISRRALLRRSIAAAAGVGAIAVVGCGDGTSDARPTPTVDAASPTQPASASATPAAPEQAAWTQLQPSASPPARRDHSLTYNSDDGHVYLFGGRAGGTASNDLWTFDLRTSTWTQLNVDGAVPPARFGHSAVYDGARGRRLVTLGQAGSSFFNDVWAFADGAWSQVDDVSAPHPTVRYGSGAAHDVQGERLYVSHGFTDQGRFDDTWAFDLRSDSWQIVETAGAVPVKRCLARNVWLPAAQQMLLFGGQTNSAPFLGDQWRLDLAATAWREEQPSPRPGPRNLYGASVDSARGRWYVVGGNTPDGPTDETWTYDLAAGSWSQVDVAAAPPPRHGLDAAVTPDGLLIFGGRDRAADLADTWLLPLPA